MNFFDIYMQYSGHTYRKKTESMFIQKSNVSECSVCLFAKSHTLSGGPWQLHSGVTSFTPIQPLYCSFWEWAILSQFELLPCTYCGSKLDVFLVASWDHSPRNVLLTLSCDQVLQIMVELHKPLGLS